MHQRHTAFIFLRFWFGLRHRLYGLGLLFCFLTGVRIQRSQNIRHPHAVVRLPPKKPDFLQHMVFFFQIRKLFSQRIDLQIYALRFYISGAFQQGFNRICLFKYPDDVLPFLHLRVFHRSHFFFFWLRRFCLVIHDDDSSLPGFTCFSACAFKTVHIPFPLIFIALAGISFQRNQIRNIVDLFIKDLSFWCHSSSPSFPRISSIHS